MVRAIEVEKKWEILQLEEQNGVPQREHRREDVRRRGLRFRDHGRGYAGDETAQMPLRSARLYHELVEHHRPVPSGNRVRAAQIRHVRLHLHGKEGCHHHYHPLRRRPISAWWGCRATRDVQEESD